MVDVDATSSASVLMPGNIARLAGWIHFLIWSKVLRMYCVHSVCKMGEIGTVCTK